MTVLPRPGAPAREAINQSISGRVIGVFAVFAVPHNLAVTCVEHILKVGLEVVESRRSLHPARSCQPSGLRKIFIATHLVQDFGSEVLSVLRLLTTLDTKEAAIGAGLNDVTPALSRHGLCRLSLWLGCSKMWLRRRCRRGCRRLDCSSLSIFSEGLNVCLPDVHQHGLDAVDVLYGQLHTTSDNSTCSETHRRSGNRPKQLSKWGSVLLIQRAVPRNVKKVWVPPHLHLTIPR